MMLSMLENDFYIFKMLASYLNEYNSIEPNTLVRYKIYTKGKGLNLDQQYRLNALWHQKPVLNLSEEELTWLQDKLRLDEAQTRKFRFLSMEPLRFFSGPLTTVMLNTIPYSALASKIFHSNSVTIETEKRAIEKLEAKAIKYPHLRWADYGLRRRINEKIHERLVIRAQEIFPNFLGTSNAYLAMKHNISPIGTIAHEYIMLHAAIYGVKNANRKAVHNWQNTTAWPHIILTDTYGHEDIFCRNERLLRKVDFIRHDSGCYQEFINLYLQACESIGIDSSTKTLVFSDSLTFEKADEIYQYCKKMNGRLAEPIFGIGGNFTCDVEGFEPLQMTVKLDKVLIKKRKQNKVVQVYKLGAKNSGKKYGKK